MEEMNMNEYLKSIGWDFRAPLLAYVTGKGRENLFRIYRDDFEQFEALAIPAVKKIESIKYEVE